MSRRELTEEENKLVSWWFKGIAATYGGLSERTAEIAESIEDQWIKDGKLSDPQLETIENIYKQSA